MVGGRVVLPSLSSYVSEVTSDSMFSSSSGCRILNAQRAIDIVGGGFFEPGGCQKVFV